MPSPEQVKALADLGGFALFLAVVIVAAIGLFRRWWVPGWWFTDERQARMSAEAENRILSRTVARLTSENKQLRSNDRGRSTGGPGA